MLLKTLDLERIFRTVKQQGYEHCELYVEIGTHAHLSAYQKLDSVRYLRTGGVGIRLGQGVQTLSLSCTQITTSAIIDTIAAKSTAGLTDAGQSTKSISSPTPLLLDSDKHFLLAKNTARHLLSRCTNEKTSCFEFSEQRREFEIASSNGDIARGSEELAQLSLRGLEIISPAETHPSQVEISRTSVDRLYNEMESEEALELWAAPFREPHPPTWPAPRGEFDLVLSPTAFSKLALRLLQAFEGDRFLGNESFLSEIPGPIPFRFRLEEQLWPGGGHSQTPVDHEGSPRRSFTFFEGGRPKGLACNRWVADQLSVPSTGHCRRESYRVPSTVGFWSAGIQGEQTKLDLLEGVSAGIFVHDLEILSYQPTTGEIELRIHRANLVHHGERGEAIDALLIKVSLPQLLSRCDLFSARRETFGFPIHKQSQSFVTEVQAPGALARSVFLPGTVPANHYW